MAHPKRLQYDVKDFFFRLGFGWDLAQYFGLPRVKRSGLEARRQQPVCVPGDPEYVHQYFRVLRMCFSCASICGAVVFDMCGEESSAGCVYLGISRSSPRLVSFRADCLHGSESS